MNVRKRGLLDLAHEIQVCTNCRRFVVTGCEPAHQNAVAAGKGFGIKSQDNRHAALCHDCHAWLDQGKGFDPSQRFADTKGEKRDMWVRAHLATFDEYWRRGWLAVA